ncbi:MAG: hypothetical protein ACHQAX_01230 [Gammaproteobacteria bacterium]
MGINAQQLKTNFITLDYKNEILKYPQLWIELLEISSRKAYEYIDLFSDNESLQLIQNSQTQATLRATLFTKYLNYIVDFSDPFDSSTIITEAHMKKMVERCLKDEVWDNDRVEIHYLNHHTSFFYEETGQYIMQKSTQGSNQVELNLGHTNIHKHLKYNSQEIRKSDTKTDFFSAYNIEHERAEAMASKCIAILDKSNEGFLDAEFQRFINGDIRRAMTQLAKLGQYDLLMAIFKKLSPAVAVDELTRGGTDSVFAILVNALPETRVILGNLINHAIGIENMTMKEFNHKILPVTLNTIKERSESLYQKLTDSSSSKPTSTQKDENELELNNIKVYENGSTFWDGMDLDEFCKVPYLIPEFIKHDLIKNPEKLCSIAKKNKYLACNYISALSDEQAKILANNASDNVLIDLFNHTVKHTVMIHQKVNDMYKLLKHANNSVCEAVFGELTHHDWTRILKNKACPLVNKLVETVTNDNASRLLGKLDFNLLNLLSGDSFFSGEEIHLYLKAPSFYGINYDNLNDKSSINFFIHHILTAAERDNKLTPGKQDVVCTLITQLLAGDASIFNLFVNKEANSLGLIFSAFKFHQLMTNQLPERTFQALQLDTWLALPKKAIGNSYNTAIQLLNFVSTENAASLLGGLQFDLLNALTEQDLYDEAQNLFVKLPSQNIPPKLIKWVEDKIKASPKATIESLGIEKILMDAISASKAAKIDARKFLAEAQENPAAACKFLQLQSDRIIEALVGSIHSIQDKYFFERIILAFDEHMPIKLMMKIDSNIIFSFSQFHDSDTTTPAIESLCMNYLKNDRFDMICALLKHASQVDLWHLHFTVLSQASFIKKSIEMNWERNIIDALRMHTDKDTNQILLTYIENVIEHFSADYPYSPKSFEVFLQSLDPECVPLLKPINSFNDLMSKNKLLHAKVLYQMNPTYFNDNAERPAIIKLKALYPDLNSDAKPIQQSTSEMDILRAENAALKLELAAIKMKERNSSIVAHVLSPSGTSFVDNQSGQKEKSVSNNTTATTSKPW